jgi:hypothetical protein
MRCHDDAGTESQVITHGHDANRHISLGPVMSTVVLCRKLAANRSWFCYPGGNRQLTGPVSKLNSHLTDVCYLIGQTTTCLIDLLG